MRFQSAARLGVLGLTVCLALPVMADNAAHDIANRFSEPAAKVDAPRDDADKKAYEAEMLERARQEAAERASDDRRAVDAEESRQRVLEAQREAEGRELAEKLKRAEEQRKAKAAEAMTKQPVGETTFKPVLTNKDRAAKPATDAAKAPVVVRPPADETADVKRDEAHSVPPVQTVEPVAPMTVPPKTVPPKAWASEPAKVLPPPMALGRPAPLPPVARVPADSRVTVLLVMEPGKKGIRRFNKSADPVLCEGALCFVSNGAAEPVRVMTMRKALGPGNTFGKRAGACRNKLACVFRGVTLDGAAPTIQPVDLKVMIHDRREPRAVSGDASCRVIAGRLSCGRTVVAAGYRAWIVPERVADEAGPQALDAAVVRGLVTAPMREASVSR